MGQKFLMAKVLLGTVVESVVAEFSKLGGTGERYATQVMAGMKPFNAWRVVGGTHPASGEPVLVRTREMIAGKAILSIQQVKPKAGFETNHGYAPINFEPVVEVQNGQYGSFVMPAEGAPEGGVVGMKYPVHREEGSLRRYIILKVAQEPQTVGGEPVPELRHYIDADSVVGGDGAALDDEAEGRNVSGPADADEDDDVEAGF